jgi:hypothetical protein
MWQDFFRAVGRGLVAIIRVLLWEPVVAITRAVFQGTSDVIRRMIPLVIGVLALWGLLTYAPELFNMLLAFVIMLWGLKIMVRGFMPAPKKKKK